MIQRNEISKKNPVVAGLMSLLLGPIGYIYIGGWFMLSGIIISVLFSGVLLLINLPIPSFLNFLQLPIYAYFGYRLAKVRNQFTNKWYPYKEDIREFKSFGFSFVIMLNLLMILIQFYSIVIGIYLSITFFSDGEILIGILILIFGIGSMIWLLSSIFAIISSLLMFLFKIDKKYF